MLGELRRPDGRELDLTLTTNGAALRALSGPLADAGLRRVTVSLDSLDDATFGAMNGVDFPVAKVLDGIDAALEAGLTPVKINMVVRRGINEDSIVPMARWARETGVTLRYIEYMDVGHSNGWRLDEVVPAAELVETVTSAWAAEPAEPAYRGEVAGRYRYLDGAGEFGIISSVTRPFCRDCTRARLSADGKLYTCLFAVAGRDLRAVLRDGSTDEELLAFLADTWRNRDDRYSELRSQSTNDLPKIEMFAMGG
jgi:cyclic pyranopterin phosphate synthase